MHCNDPLDSSSSRLGQYISTFSNRAIPYCIKYNPDEDKQNEFVAGCSDKKIVQYDTRSGEVSKIRNRREWFRVSGCERTFQISQRNADKNPCMCLFVAGQIVQEYNQHLGAVNTITFIDQNRRFVSSSDDKTLRVWEWGIPVVIKNITDPTKHSMPAVAPHPNVKWVCCQSLDNQVCCTLRKRLSLFSTKGYMSNSSLFSVTGAAFSRAHPSREISWRRDKF